jgi:catechol 2,3-dioxygenase-like lactoylglutathione lyase family enzyme
MKRLHVHVAVDDLAESVRFYATLFAAEPTVAKPDYAKWMLDDPRVNFAISARRAARTGVEHLGIQVETEAELADVYDRLSRADRPVVEQQATTCCYARSDKQWISDPQGVAWETFLTRGQAVDYGRPGAAGRLVRTEEPSAETAPPSAGACCGPARPAAAAACCGSAA